MDDYKVARRIAEGRFGAVFAACRVSTGEQVAIKKIRSRRPMPGFTRDPWSRSAQREIEVLSRVKHRHVVSMIDHFVSPEGSLAVLVYEYLAWDLCSLLAQRQPMDEGHVKSILQMLLHGLAHLHAHGVMHRDLKPANLLLEGPTGCLKIADFGSARFHPASAPGGAHALPEEQEGPLTREVCTRWYMSPEMLFGSVDYTLSVDLWAVGCIAGELASVEGRPAFPGGSDLEQLCLIFERLGTIQEDEWPEARQLPDYGKVEFTAREARPFDVTSHCSPCLVRLAGRFLQLNPAWRLPAADALDEEFFHAQPPASEPQCLLLGLGEMARPESGQEAPPRDDFTPLRESDYGSDDSALGCPGTEFEPIQIETTTCGLWEDDVPLGRDDQVPQHGGPLPAPGAGSGVPPDAVAMPGRHRTPSPPRSGVHRLRSAR